MSPLLINHGLLAADKLPLIKSVYWSVKGAWLVEEDEDT